MQINLLPWREELRQTKKKQLLSMMGLYIALSLLILAVIHLHYRGIANNQNKLNTMLSDAITAEQGVLNQIGSKATEAIDVEKQLKFVIQLYDNNYRAVRLLNDLVSLVSDNVSIDEIRRNGNTIDLSGLAKSEEDIEQLMKDIQKSQYFDQPVLLSTNVGNSADSNTRNFNIRFAQTG
jgi:type IV pilus assembly protein PilN